MKKIITGIMVLASFAGVGQIAAASPTGNGVYYNYNRHVTRTHKEPEQRMNLHKLTNKDCRRIRVVTRTKNDMRVQTPQTKERDIHLSDLLLSDKVANEKVNERFQQANKKRAIKPELLKTQRNFEKKENRKHPLNKVTTQDNLKPNDCLLDEVLYLSSSDFDFEEGNVVKNEKITIKPSKSMKQPNNMESKTLADTTSTDFEDFKEAINNRVQRLEVFKIKEAKKNKQRNQQKNVQKKNHHMDENGDEINF